MLPLEKLFWLRLSIGTISTQLSYFDVSKMTKPFLSLNWMNEWVFNFSSVILFFKEIMKKIKNNNKNNIHTSWCSFWRRKAHEMIRQFFLYIFVLEMSCFYWNLLGLVFFKSSPIIVILNKYKLNHFLFFKHCGFCGTSSDF